jgi:serine/threonine protein kinase
MNTLLNATTQNDDLPQGTTLMRGHFTLLHTIHSGGFGMAYLAVDPAGERVVVKECFPEAFCKRVGKNVMPLSIRDREDFAAIQKQFQNEARVLAMLDHSNVVGIRNVFEENGTSYMALDHIKGRDLADLLKDPSFNPTPTEMTKILCGALSALSYVHEQGFLHSDISPDNIIITPDMKPYLIDFGSARDIAPTSSLGMPVMRAVKDGYSPQEFYIAGGKTGSFSDIYSLAATFYHVITGQRPPSAQVRLKVLSRQQDDPYKGLGELAPEYPEAFIDALDQAISAFPRRRQTEAMDWHAAIEIKEAPVNAELIPFPFTHSHAPKGTGIYRNPAE